MSSDIFFSNCQDLRTFNGRGPIYKWYRRYFLYNKVNIKQKHTIVKQLYSNKDVKKKKSA